MNKRQAPTSFIGTPLTLKIGRSYNTWKRYDFKYRWNNNGLIPRRGVRGGETAEHPSATSVLADVYWLRVRDAPLRGLRAFAAGQSRGGLGLQDLGGLGLRRLRRLGANARREGLPLDQQFHLGGVQHLALEQRLRDADERVAVRAEDVFGALVAAQDELFHFLVDLDRRVFAEVALGSQVAPQENSLLVLAVGERPQVRHPKLAHHPSSQLRSLLDIVAGPGGDVVQEQFLSHPPTRVAQTSSFCDVCECWCVREP